MSVVSTAQHYAGLDCLSDKNRRKSAFNSDRKRELTQLDLGPTDAGLVCSQIARGNNVWL